jgi:hypothetical protein
VDATDGRAPVSALTSRQSPLIAAFDSNGNGSIDASDLAQFVLHLGRRLVVPPGADN